MEQSEMVKVLARLGAAWPQANITEPTQRVWMEHLESISFDAACEAARSLESSSKFYPSIAEFEEACHGEVEDGGRSCECGALMWLPGTGWMEHQCPLDALELEESARVMEAE